MIQKWELGLGGACERGGSPLQACLPLMHPWLRVQGEGHLRKPENMWSVTQRRILLPKGHFPKDSCPTHHTQDFFLTLASSVKNSEGVLPIKPHCTSSTRLRLDGPAWPFLFSRKTEESSGHEHSRLYLGFSHN